MPILRLTDGQKRLLLSLHGVWQHEWLLVAQAICLNNKQEGFSRLKDLRNSLRYWQSHG